VAELGGIQRKKYRGFNEGNKEEIWQEQKLENNVCERNMRRKEE
jgi:hypothetical protein